MKVASARFCDVAVRRSHLRHQLADCSTSTLLLSLSVLVCVCPRSLSVGLTACRGLACMKCDCLPFSLDAECTCGSVHSTVRLLRRCLCMSFAFCALAVYSVLRRLSCWAVASSFASRSAVGHSPFGSLRSARLARLKCSAEHCDHRIRYTSNSRRRVVP